MKFGFAILLVACACVTIANGQKNNNNVKVWGQRLYNDRRVFHEIVIENRSYISNFGITKKEIEYPNKVN